MALDSLLHVIEHKDSLLRALSARLSSRDTVAVEVLGHDPLLGFVTDSAKVVRGAVLALGTSWWLESRRRGQDDQRARRPLKLRLETEAHLVLLADRIATKKTRPNAQALALVRSLALRAYVQVF